MDCSPIREALSAALDHEDPGLPDHVVRQHLEGCRGCRAWADEVGVLHRLTRVRPAEPVPDLTAAIVAAADLHAAPTVRSAHQARSRRSGMLDGLLREPISTVRWALFTVALTQLVLAVPGVALGVGADATVHVTREIGSFDIALAVGLLVAAWQPSRAWGLLPLAGALGLVLGGTALVDMVDGSASTVGEAHHLLDLAGVALLWLVARQAPALSPTASRRRPGRPAGRRWSAA
jgi:predicted anti-sigma-YlaC factor YlaD